MLWILENHHYKLCELYIFLSPIRFLPTSLAVWYLVTYQLERAYGLFHASSYHIHDAEILISYVFTRESSSRNV